MEKMPYQPELERAATMATPSTVTTTNWLVRESATTLLRLSLKVPWTAERTLLGEANFNWITRVNNGSNAAGSFVVMRAILVLLSSTICNP